MGLDIANDRLRVGIATQGGVLTYAETLDGRAFLRGRAQGDDPTQSACFPMLPLCNRVGGNGFAFQGADYTLAPNSSDPLYLHGDGWLADWSVAAHCPDQVQLDLHHRGDGPFAYHASQHIALHDNRLTLRLSITNDGAAPMPFGLGFHPYFPRQGATACFNADAWWQAGAGHLPVNRQSPVPEAVDFSTPRPLPDRTQNNAYETWDGGASIHWPAQGLSLDLQADPLFGALMLYAPDDDSSFFCLEPMTHLPNALNMPGQPGMQVLTQGQTLCGTITMTIHMTEPKP